MKVQFLKIREYEEVVKITDKIIDLERPLQDDDQLVMTRNYDLMRASERNPKIFTGQRTIEFQSFIAAERLEPSRTEVVLSVEFSLTDFSATASRLIITTNDSQSNVFIHIEISKGV